MKINLHILADELSAYNPEVYCGNSLDLDLSRFEVYRRQANIDAGCLYIIEAKDLLPELLCIKDAHWLCCGEISGSLLNCRCGSILILPDWRWIVDLDAVVSRVFEKYNAWSDQLLTLCMSNDGIRQAFKTNLLENMFENPILMQNGVGLYAISCGELPDDFDSARWIEISKFDNKRRGAYSLANAYGKDGDLLRHPFISEVTQNYQFLSTNAFNGGLLAGRLTHCNVRRPFTNGYLSMANYLNSVFEIIMARNIQDDLVGGGDSSVFVELLGTWHTNSEWLDGRLRRIGWNQGEAAYLVVTTIRNSQSSTDPLRLQLIASRVEKVFAGEFVFEYRHNVVAVIRGDNYVYDARLIKRKLETAMRGCDAVCMVSLVFYDISKIREYYEQCLFLIERESGNSKEVGLFWHPCGLKMPFSPVTTPLPADWTFG